MSGRNTFNNTGWQDRGTRCHDKQFIKCFHADKPGATKRQSMGDCEYHRTVNGIANNAKGL